MKKLSVLFLSLAMLLACGCSDSQTDKSKAAAAFFGAFNHLCEADSLDAQGDFTYGSLSGSYTLQFVNSDNPQAALQVSAQSQPLASFYLYNGKTFLDYLGTRSSSKAENIGIEPGQKFKIPNPFLDMSASERDECFDSVSLENNTYTFEINKDALEKMLDAYGSALISSAVLKAEIIDGNLKSFSLSIQGESQMDALHADLDLSVSMDILSINQSLQIEMPQDLDSWND